MTNEAKRNEESVLTDLLCVASELFKDSRGLTPDEVEAARQYLKKHYRKVKECEWESVNWIIKWTLRNAKHLNEDDTYLIEKATDECHGEFLRLDT